MSMELKNNYLKCKKKKLSVHAWERELSGKCIGSRGLTKLKTGINVRLETREHNANTLKLDFFFDKPN